MRQPNPTHLDPFIENLAANLHKITIMTARKIGICEFAIRFIIKGTVSFCIRETAKEVNKSKFVRPSGI